MFHFGFDHDLRTQSSWDTLVESVVQKEDALDCPLSKEPCLDGLVKVLSALLCKAPEYRSARDRQAIDIVCNHLLDYPFEADKGRGSWMTLRFPRHTDTDLIEVCHVLARSPYNADRRLEQLIEWMIDMQDDEGRWWKRRATPVFQEERIFQPSRWLTLEAVHTLALVLGDNPYAA